MSNDTLKNGNVNYLQKELLKNDKLKSPIIMKLSKYLKTQENGYVEIQRLPRYLFTENILSVLDKFNVSFYKVNKVGNHVKAMKTFDDDINTYIFIIKNNLPNNILLSANHIFSAY